MTLDRADYIVTVDAPTIASLRATAKEHLAEQEQVARLRANEERQRLFRDARAAVSKVLNLEATDTDIRLSTTIAGDIDDSFGVEVNVRYAAPDGDLWFRFTPNRYLGLDYGYSGEQVRVLTSCDECAGHVLHDDATVTDRLGVGLVLARDPAPYAINDRGHMDVCSRAYKGADA